jgi:hypothetical protein
MALMGAARALSSGPAESWYVDTVHAEAGPEADLRTGLARGSSAQSAGLAVGTLFGGSVPWLLGLGPNLGARLSEATGGVVLPLSVPKLIGAAVEVCFVLYVLSALREPPRTPTTLRAILRDVPATVVGGVRLGVSEATVRRVLLTAGATGVGFAAVELLAPGRAAGVTGDAESGAGLYAALACVGFAAAGIGASLAPLTARLARSGERAVLVSMAVAACGLVLLAGTAAFGGPLSLGLAALGFVVFYLGVGASGPSENELLHRRVSSKQRATALSVQSLCLQLMASAGGLAMGSLPVGPWPWLLGGAVMVAGALLWARRAPAGTAVVAPPSGETPLAGVAVETPGARVSG